MSKIRSKMIPGILEKFRDSNIQVFIEPNGKVVALQRGQVVASGNKKWVLQELGRFNRRLLKRVMEPQEDLQVIANHNIVYAERLKNWLQEKVRT